VVLCTYGAVCMIVHVLFRGCGAMYMWCSVNVVLCTCCAYGFVYMWCYVQFVQLVLCIHDVMYMLCKWCNVYVVL